VRPWWFSPAGNQDKAHEKNIGISVARYRNDRVHGGGGTGEREYPGNNT
jgi:hypothetical protein